MAYDLAGCLVCKKWPSLRAHFRQEKSFTSSEKYLNTVTKHLIIDLFAHPTVYISYFHTHFHKKLGSGHSTKSFLIQHEILSMLVLKLSELVSYFLNA